MLCPALWCSGGAQRRVPRSSDRRSIRTIRHDPSPASPWGLRTDVEVQPDGTLATSRQIVVVAVDRVESISSAVQSHAEVPFNVPEKAVANRLWQDHVDRSSQARQISQAPLHIAKRQDVAVSQLLHATAADGGSSSAVVEPKIATTVVSRGDRLWRISHVNYGARYAFLYKANRDQIRDPNRIYPGQIFVLPMKAR